MQPDSVAEMLAHFRPNLLRSDEQIRSAVSVDHRISKRDRCMRDVLAADIERPGDGVERREYRGVGMMLDQPVADLGALLRRGLARIFVRLDDEVRFRRLGTVGPDLVDRIAFDRHQLGAAAGKRFLRLLHPVARVQPRVIADARAFGRMFLEPLRRARLGHRLIAPLGRADLLADLEGVAAVDEDRGLLWEDDGRAGGTLEAGQPGEALRVASDIFAHMLVGERDDEAVELLGLQLFAKGFEAIGVCGHGLNSLEPQLMQQRPFLKCRDLSRRRRRREYTDVRTEAPPKRSGSTRSWTRLIDRWDREPCGASPA